MHCSSCWTICVVRQIVALVSHIWLSSWWFDSVSITDTHWLKPKDGGNPIAKMNIQAISDDHIVLISVHTPTVQSAHNPVLHYRTNLFLLSNRYQDCTPSMIGSAHRVWSRQISLFYIFNFFSRSWLQYVTSLSVRKYCAQSHNPSVSY